MPETRDPLEALAEEEAAERAAIEAEHAANTETQRALDAEKRATAGDEPPAEGEQEEDGDDEPRLLAGKYESVEEMERAYTELQSKFGDAGRRAGEAEARLRQYEQGAQNVGVQPAQQGLQVGPDGQPLMSKEELDEWYVEDPVGATFYLSQLAARAVAEEQNQALAPVLQQVNNSAAASALEQVKRELGADGEQMLQDHREALIAAMEADRGHFVDPQTRVAHMKQAVLTAAWETGTLPSRNGSGTRKTRAAAKADVHVEGGSGAQPAGSRATGPQPTPEEQELLDLHPVTGWKRETDEMGIPLPYGPLG